MGYRLVVVASAVLLAGRCQSLAQTPGDSSQPQVLVQGDDASPSGDAATGIRTTRGLVRPKDAVKHPTLDTSWAEYANAVTKATKSVRDAIEQQFDAATSKGDLIAAEKWQLIRANFEKSGEFPTEHALASVVSEAVAECKKASVALGQTYESVVETLTKEHKNAEAERVRSEWQGVNARVDVGALLNKELLRNGGAEEPAAGGEVPGWKQLQDGWQLKSGKAGPNDGLAHFWPPPVAAAEIYQDVQLTQFAALTRAGELRLEFRGAVRSFDQKPADSARIVLEIRDAENNNILDSLDLGDVQSVKEWKQLSAARMVHREAGWVRVRLKATRFEGDNNDAYFDSLSLKVTSGSEPQVGVKDQNLPLGPPAGAAGSGILGMKGWGSWEGVAPHVWEKRFADRGLPKTEGIGFFVESLGDLHAEGLKKFDIVVRIDGDKVDSKEALAKSMAKLKAGGKTRFAIKRYMAEEKQWKLVHTDVVPADKRILEQRKAEERERAETERQRQEKELETKEFKLADGGIVTGARIKKHNEGVEKDVAAFLLKLDAADANKFDVAVRGFVPIKQALLVGDRPALGRYMKQVAESRVEIRRAIAWLVEDTPSGGVVIPCADGRALHWREAWTEAMAAWAEALKAGD